MKTEMLMHINMDSKVVDTQVVLQLIHREEHKQKDTLLEKEKMVHHHLMMDIMEQAVVAIMGDLHLTITLISMETI